MSRNDPFSALLISEGLVSAEQLAEVTRVAESSGKKLHDEIVRLGYAPGDKVMRALAKAHRLKFVDLTGITVEQDVIDLLPESVARENSIFPVSKEGNTLRIAGSDPTDIDSTGDGTAKTRAAKRINPNLARSCRRKDGSVVFRTRRGHRFGQHAGARRQRARGDGRLVRLVRAGWKLTAMRHGIGAMT